MSSWFGVYFVSLKRYYDANRVLVRDIIEVRGNKRVMRDKIEIVKASSN